MGLLVLFVGVMICSAPFFGGRWVAHRWLRIQGAGVFSLEVEERYFTLARIRRWAWRLAGPIAAYVACVVLAFVTIELRGQSRATNTVNVLPGGPAARAGIERGDRILAIDEVEPETWEQIRSTISTKSAGGPISMKVERGGESRVFNVVPENGKIQISSQMERVSQPVGRALLSAVATPLEAVLGRASGVLAILAGRTPPIELAGPVGIASVGSQPGATPAFALLLFAVAASAQCVWPVAIILEIVLTPRRRRRCEAGDRRSENAPR